jgi:nucleoid-associated protein YgaU
MPLFTANSIQQPQAFDLVGDNLMIAGIGTGFEGTLNWRVHDGHDERTGSVNAGDGVGGHGQFQVKVDLTGAAFQLDRIFVEVFEEDQSGAGEERNKVIVPVIYGPLVMAGYTTFFRHRVVRGETLTSITNHYYGDPQFMPRIIRSNPAIINPNQIFAGQELRVPVSAG